MESGNGAAGDGNKYIGPPGTGNDGAATGCIDRCKGHLDGGVNEKEADSQGSDNADFHKGAQVIPRGQKQPDGDGGGAETVDRQEDRHLLFR